MSNPHEITDLIQQARSGSRTAMDVLVPKLYDRLRKVAERCLKRESQTITLSPTALVHEVYLDLIGSQAVAWQDRAHFLAYAASAMRTFLVDYARARGAKKRGGNIPVIDWESVDIPATCVSSELLALDQALQRLSELDMGLARIVELKFFGGMSGDETAEVMGISASSVDRGWEKARILLHAYLK